MGTAIHLMALGKEKPGSKIKAKAATSGYSKMRGNILGEISALNIPQERPLKTLEDKTRLGAMQAVWFLPIRHESALQLRKAVQDECR